MSSPQHAHFEGAWRHRIPGVSPSTDGRYACEADLRRAGVPASLAGQRLLDVGCSDGGHSFLAEKRGAQVVSIDSQESPANEGRNGFEMARDTLGSSAQYHPLALGDFAAAHPDAAFDRIFCFNVLYHVEDIVGAVQQLHDLLVPGGTVHVKCLVASRLPERLQRFLPARWGERGRPVAQFVADTFEGDPTNWWIPSPAALVALMRSAGLRDVAIVDRDVNRLFVNGTRVG